MHFCLVDGVFFSTHAAANSDSHEYQFTSSFGLGSQYAGIIGAQFGVDNNKHKFYGAVGLLGLGAGYNYAVGENTAVGINAFFLSAIAGYGVSANYYFGSTFSTGWMIGVDVFSISATLVGDGGEGANGEIAAFISLGYVF